MIKLFEKPEDKSVEELFYEVVEENFNLETIVCRITEDLYASGKSEEVDMDRIDEALENLLPSLPKINCSTLYDALVEEGIMPDPDL